MNGLLIAGAAARGGVRGLRLPVQDRGEEWTVKEDGPEAGVPE